MDKGTISESTYLNLLHDYNSLMDKVKEQERRAKVFIGKIVYAESGSRQKLETKEDNIYKLLEVISKFNDIDILEVHIYKEVV